MKPRAEEKLTVKQIPGIPYLRIVQGTGISNEFARHAHSQLCIGIVLSGSRTMSFVKDEYTFNKNDMFIINPGQVHSCTAGEGRPHCYMVLTVAPEAAGLRHSMFRNMINRRDGLHRNFMKLAATLTGDMPLLEKECAVHSFLNLLAEAYATEPVHEKITAKSRSAVQRAMEFLNSRPDNKVSLEELAEVAGLSQFHFNRLFCRVTGLSPYAYHLYARIEHAKHMLTSGKTIVEAALDSGFSDQSHFSRYFKKIVGVTPGVYVKHNSEEANNEHILKHN